MSGPPGNILGLTYGYGTSNNNGNMQSQAISVLGVAQTYNYDPLNRLKSAQETNGPGWSQTFGYDNYGNRYVSAVTGLSISALTPTLASNFTPGTNRLNGGNSATMPPATRRS